MSLHLRLYAEINPSNQTQSQRQMLLVSQLHIHIDQELDSTSSWLLGEESLIQRPEEQSSATNSTSRHHAKLDVVLSDSAYNLLVSSL